VVVQENLQPSRVGRALSVERQKRMNANVQELHEFKIGAVLVDGFTDSHPLDGHSVIEIHLEITTADGYRIQIEELGLQTWKDGRIIRLYVAGKQQVADFLDSAFDWLAPKSAKHGGFC
jgi:hypothetical protein